MLYPWACYYAAVAAVYLTFGALYGAGVQKAVTVGEGLFPVMHSKPHTLLRMALQLVGIGGASSGLAYALWLHWWPGAVVALAVSMYEVYLSWTFYRQAAADYMQLARLTFNAASSAWFVAWLWGVA